MSNHRITLATALCVGAGALGLAACGGDDNGNGGGEGPPSVQEARAAAVKFARCMREHGIDMPDPRVGEDGGLEIQVGGEKGRGPSRTKMEEADKACRKFLPKGGKPPSEEQQAEFRKQALAFARCMREHGINMPDPQFQEGGKVTMQGGPGDGPGGPKPDSRRFREANDACAKDMKGGPGFGLSVGGGDAK